MTFDYRAALRRSGTRYVDRGQHLLVLCPFHADNNPSLQLEVVSGKFPAGFYHCWGCGASGRWNKLAARLGAEQQEVEDQEVVRRPRASAFASVQELAGHFGGGTRPWPGSGAFREWRGIGAATIKKVGGQLLHTNQEVRLLLPVSVHGEYVGGVACHLTGEKTRHKYLTTPGAWASTKGFFPFDAVASDNPRYVVLVEGPRDALRLLEAGIPALALLGAANVSPQKMTLLSHISALKLVVALGDGDEAGKILNRKLWKIGRDQGLEVLPLRLPEGADPFSLSDRQLDLLRTRIDRKLQTLVPPRVI